MVPIFLARWLAWLNARSRELIAVKRVFLRRRLRDDLAAYGMTTADPLKRVTLNFQGDCVTPSCVGHCLPHYVNMRGHIGDDHFSWRNLHKPAALLMDLDEFATFASYTSAVSKASRGNDLRAAKKARKLGYQTRRVGWNSLLRSREVVDKSKLFRSGLVIGALERNVREELHDIEYPYAPPTCDRHWIIDWAAFRSPETGGALVGVGSIQRAGNFMNFRRFIGHGDVLRDGVMKMLMFDIMEWILAREDPAVIGLRHLNYGSLEEGGAGMRQWKRYMQFSPRAVDVPYNEDLELFPRDFDAAAYLKLNPDVARSGMPARSHYRWWGVHEGRRWR